MRPSQVNGEAQPMPTNTRNAWGLNAAYEIVIEVRSYHLIWLISAWLGENPLSGKASQKPRWQPQKDSCSPHSIEESHTACARMHVVMVLGAKWAT